MGKLQAATQDKVHTKGVLSEKVRNLVRNTDTHTLAHTVVPHKVPAQSETVPFLQP